MGFLDKLASVATGGLAGAVLDVVKTYFPPDLSAEKKAEMQVAIERLAMERERNTNDAIRDSEQAINERIRAYEGTASDLASLPILGPIMLFLRGAQRPIIGYATMYLDYQVFSGTWELTPGQQESAFWVINLLVLGFLFGERAVKNVAPMITGMVQARR
jgi:hypothetical protein